MVNFLNKLLPKKYKKTNYKELYEIEVNKRKELESVFNMLCNQINSVTTESKTKYNMIKFNEDKKF